MILVISQETYNQPFNQTGKLRRSAKDAKSDKQMEHQGHVGSHCGAEIIFAYGVRKIFKPESGQVIYLKSK